MGTGSNVLVGVKVGSNRARSFPEIALALVIEGDEAYTKVQKNVPPDQSLGWTILLLDRASRFIWEIDCGKKERKLFHKAITSLDKIARQTHDLSLFTDGERRYGNLLFEIYFARDKMKLLRTSGKSEVA